LLQNGGFEQGKTGWTGPSLSTSGCDPHGGNSALSIPGFAQQSLPEPVGSGTYTLTGWLKGQAGSSPARLSFVWLDQYGDELSASEKDLESGSAYSAVGLQAASPAGAYGLRVRITASGNALCADDFALDGPPTLPPPTATSPATATPPAAAQSGSTATPRASATAKATATPRPTATARPSAAPGFGLVNGGFEEGLKGWSKFGGNLEAVDWPVQSGRLAGRLTSATDSTKWAFQTVLVDPSLHYQFEGYVGSDAGVLRAYLRISWYASGDGSGTALDTSDSTTTISGSSAFVYLSTGAVQPPAGAHSARPRVVMTPLGAGTAAIVFDDLAFGPVEPPAEPEPASPAESQTEAVAAAPDAASPAGSTAIIASGQSVPDSGARATPDQARAAPTAQLADVLPAGPLALSPGGDDGVPLIWLGSAVALVGLSALAYWQGKRNAA
jgi:hypothetical protein